ncbi:hypothetical protein A8C75_01680 [Marinobacterium aestuarii]|uniref:DUF2383 domain-containing protein n=1 Tax=Marinobacterium aestuarii TaxID=1821621 RepID=A0A1A9EUG5_9GAMM|nr:hypothetical protein [Marinobacterium aestuarii]ANG61298.1 hypothetical protein A8C75_01680 [Marinobacterium aestuarii]
MKNFETVADLVNNAIAVHREAASLYRDLDQRSEDARARLVLEYLIKHEQQMETGVKNRLRAGTPGMLATYIQYTFEDAPNAFMAALAKEFPKPNADQVCEIALRVDGYLVDLFEGARQEIDAAHAIEYLDDLLQLESLERRKLTQTLNSLHDI